ncbi:hypothetical protein ACTQ2Q_01965 [Atopobiaceae bacterium LCP21S3_F11]
MAVACREVPSGRATSYKHVQLVILRQAKNMPCLKDLFSRGLAKLC